MEKYNLDKLIKVALRKAEPSSWYKYKPEKKFLGFITQEAGVYEGVFNSYMGNEAPSNHFIEKDIVYVQPKVILFYECDFRKDYYFDSYVLAAIFRDEIIKTGSWID